MGKFSSLTRKKKSKSQSSVNSENDISRVPENDTSRQQLSTCLDYSDSEFDDLGDYYPHGGNTDFPG